MADNSLIPKGHYCYEPIGWDGGVYKVKPCPYWQYTDHGTVLCKYLNVESIDPTTNDNYDLLVKHFGSELAAYNATEDGGLIWDQIKECGINDGEDEQ